jgi:CubicO group peptidase (beta-lactamase class C family)
MLVLVLLGVVAPVRAHPAQNAPPDFAAIDAFVEREMRDMRIPGMALGIVQGDRIAHLKGFGIAKPDGTPVTPQTPFDIASLAKSMTAVAVLQLAEQGTIDLDAPVQRYIPWFRVADLAASSQITVRHLLNQTSGLPGTQNFANVGRPDTADGARERRVQALKSVTLAHQPGTAYAYVGANFVTLTLVIEAAAGQSYEQYMAEHVFAPLGMRQSFTTATEARQHGLATGYRSWFGGTQPIDPPFDRGNVGAGNVFSSAEDMARYLLAHLDSASAGAQLILSASSIAELHRPAVAIDAGEAFYGMGWEIEEGPGGVTLSHSGTAPNFWSRMMLVPASRSGIVLVTNVRSLQNAPRLIALTDGVAALLQGNAPLAPSLNPLLLVYRVLMTLVVLELGVVVWSLHTLWHWRSEPTRRPQRGWRSILGYVGLPLGFQLLVACFGLVTVPLLYTSSIFVALPAMLTLDFDLGIAGVASGSTALLWGIVGAALMLRELCATQHPTPAAAIAPGTVGHTNRAP